MTIQELQFDSRLGLDMFLPSISPTSALRPTQRLTMSTGSFRTHAASCTTYGSLGSYSLVQRIRMRGAIPALRPTTSWPAQRRLYLHLKALGSRYLTCYFGCLQDHHLALGAQISGFSHIPAILQTNVKFPWKLGPIFLHACRTSRPGSLGLEQA